MPGQAAAPSSRSASDPAPARPALDLALAAALMAAVFAVYVPVRTHAFVDLDDLIYLHQNPIVRSGLTWQAVRDAFTTVHAAYWIPLTWLSFALDLSLYGPDAGRMLLENVTLHAGSSVLLYLALSRMTRARAPSFLVAALFALHPLHVESVAWVSERKDCLSAFFFMLALHAWAVYAEGPATFRRRLPATGWFALGLLAKPAIFPLPFALLIVDFWPLGRLGSATGAFDPRRVRAAVVEKLPMFALAIAAALLVVITQAGAGAMALAELVPWTVRLRVAAESWGFYLVKTVWPSGLAAHYPMPFVAPPAWSWIGSLTLVVALTVVAIVAVRTRPWLSVGWAWFVVILLPASGLLHVGVQARADRWTYLPMIGLGMAAAWEASSRLRGRGARRAVLAAALVVLVALGVAARRQVGWWRDSATLFRRAWMETKDNRYVADRIAQDFRRRGMVDSAAVWHLETIRLAPGWARPQTQLAEIWDVLGDSTAAAVLRDNAARVSWTDPASARLTARALVDAGRPGEAIPLFERALARTPGDAGLEAELRSARAAAAP